VWLHVPRPRRHKQHNVGTLHTPSVQRRRPSVQRRRPSVQRRRAAAALRYLLSMTGGVPSLSTKLLTDMPPLMMRSCDTRCYHALGRGAQKLHTEDAREHPMIASYTHKQTQQRHALRPAALTPSLFAP
jgi:hypothetical protein